MTAVITGRAWRTPLGADIGRAIDRMLAGERAAVPNTRFVGASYGCNVVAPIREDPEPSRQARFVPRMGLFALEVAREAMREAGASGGERVGVFAGVGGLRVNWDELLPALYLQHADAAGAWDLGLKELHPFWLLRHLSNNAQALAAAELEARGEGLTFGGANAGAQALAAAQRALAAGSVDVAVVMAYDSLIEPEVLVELQARRVATQDADPRPPYDARATGLVPGEAAAALVLERSESAHGRALAQLSAAASADGAEAEPHPSALARAVLTVAAGDAIVDGAARAWPEHDQSERHALAGALGKQARLIATSSATGHVGAATSVVQAIALAELLRRGVMPGIPVREVAPGPLEVLERSTPVNARSAVAVCAGAPGLVGAIRVEVV